MIESEKKEKKREKKRKAFQTSTPCLPIVAQEKSLTTLSKKKKIDAVSCTLITLMCLAH